MFDGMKYIVIDSGMNDELYIFPNWVDHANFANKLFPCSAFEKVKERVISAGKVTCDALNPPTCSGRSVSLEKNSRGEVDTDLLRRQMGWNKYD